MVVNFRKLKMRVSFWDDQGQGMEFGTKRQSAEFVELSRSLLSVYMQGLVLGSACVCALFSWRAAFILFWKNTCPGGGLNLVLVSDRAISHPDGCETALNSVF